MHKVFKNKARGCSIPLIDLFYRYSLSLLNWKLPFEWIYLVGQTCISGVPRRTRWCPIAVVNVSHAIKLSKNKQQKQLKAKKNFGICWCKNIDKRGVKHDLDKKGWRIPGTVPINTQLYGSQDAQTWELCTFLYTGTMMMSVDHWRPVKFVAAGSVLFWWLRGRKCFSLLVISLNYLIV